MPGELALTWCRLDSSILRMRSSSFMMILGDWGSPQQAKKIRISEGGKSWFLQMYGHLPCLRLWEVGKYEAISWQAVFEPMLQSRRLSILSLELYYCLNVKSHYSILYLDAIIWKRFWRKSSIACSSPSALYLSNSQKSSSTNGSISPRESV